MRRSVLPKLLVPVITVPLLGLVAGGASAQDIADVDVELLAEVMPDAERFGEVSGDPPVIRAFAADAAGDESLVGFLFMTSDIPPEAFGYSAPIDVLVGMDTDGVLTGIEVVDYRESLRRSRGDFLDRSSFLGQFAGKHVAEPFRIRNDIDGIAGASITVDAMSRGIRNAARRVAAAYLNAEPDAPPRYIATIAQDELANMLWAEILDQGLATQLTLPDGPIDIVLAMVYVRDPPIGEMFVGSTYFQAAFDTLGVTDEDEMMLMGLNGGDSFFFRPSALSFVQGADTLVMSTQDIQMLPLLREGKLQGEVRRSGLVRVPNALDLARPFEVALDMSPRGGAAASQYTVFPPTAPPALDGAPLADAGSESADGGTSAAAGPSAGAAGPEIAQASDGQDAPTLPAADTPRPASSAEVGSQAPTLPEADPAGPSIDYEALLLEEEDVEQSAFDRVLERTSWPRVGGFLALLALATAAFVTKRSVVRWATLGATFAWLGFVDGGFLSISHVMAGISVGPEVYVGDIPLFLIVTFTVVTTLLFGRVFCGFLCPFGALQDFLERIVPERLRRELPKAVHDRAAWIKYGILAVVLAPPVLGSSLSLFQFFEPFGTVFYLSSSIVLWAIASGILLASAVIPRFYCRYMCPLGAALAIGSLLAPFRIRRVEQCDVCKVCEQACPTGAITGPRIDFKECVRCNACEIKLIEKAGVCRHDMAKVRRLVELPMAREARS